MSDCRFDADTHRYYIREREVVGVTTVINDLLPGYQAGTWYLVRGRAVHACAAMIAKGQQFNHDPRIAGQVEALRKFYREVQPDVIDVEQQVYHRTLMYGGTYDLYCQMRHKTVVDFKASLGKSIIYQLAAYALAHPDQPDYGIGVEIREDGDYVMSDLLNLKQAKREWLSLLAAHNIRKRLGHTNKEDKDYE